MLVKTLLLAALAGKALATASEQFTNLNNWASDSFYNGPTPLPADFKIQTPQAGTSDNYALIIYATSNNYTTVGGVYSYGERPKQKYTIPSNLNSNKGTHAWKLYIPPFRNGDVNAMAGFVYCDDHHELDFEVGYGTSSLRSTWGISGSSTYTLCMTSQDTSSNGSGTPAQKCIPVNENWYTLSLNIAPVSGSDARAVATWSVNGVQQFTVTNQWTMMSCGVLVPRVSLENLAPGYMGNGGAQDMVYQAVFDSYTFT